MSGKYDPPNEAKLLADNPSIESTVELMVATPEAQFPPKMKCEATRQKIQKASHD